MGSVRVEALRWIAEDAFPRVLEVRLTDVDGVGHLLIDKEPAFSDRPVDVPGLLDIECTIDSADGERVAVTLDHGIVAPDDRATFVVSRELVEFEA